MALEVAAGSWACAMKAGAVTLPSFLKGRSPQLYGKGCWPLVFKTRIRWNPVASPNLFFFHCHVMVALGLASSVFFFFSICCIKNRWLNNLILSAFPCDLIPHGLRRIKRVPNKVRFAQTEEGFDLQPRFMIIKGKTSWTGCWRENWGLVIRANGEKLLLFFIFLVLCFPAAEAVVFCLFQTETNNDLRDALMRRVAFFFLSNFLFSWKGRHFPLSSQLYEVLHMECCSEPWVLGWSTCFGDR